MRHSEVDNREWTGYARVTLIGVPDLGLAETERRLQRGQTEAGLHGLESSQLSTKRLNQSITATR
jgi:hypothetical protein